MLLSRRSRGGWRKGEGKEGDLSELLEHLLVSLMTKGSSSAGLTRPEEVGEASCFFDARISLRKLIGLSFFFLRCHVVDGVESLNLDAWSFNCGSNRELLLLPLVETTPEHASAPWFSEGPKAALKWSSWRGNGESYGQCFISLLLSRLDNMNL